MSPARPSFTPAARRATTQPGPVGGAARGRFARSVLGVTAALCALAGPATAAAAGVTRIETPIASTSPQTDVASSLVELRVPMPAAAAPHPEACDWIQYERFRLAAGPTDPMRADAVAVLMPGILEGATAFDPLARNSIREAARRGQTMEVWAIDRRANCLEDRTGLTAAERTGQAADALDYYYRGAEINGRRFAGWNASDRVLADIGVGQTINDYNAVLTNELPSRPWREQHVICGGHSLGGPLTELYAAWDFDGDPKTTADAGYRQCAGFIGFDTVLDSGSADPRQVPKNDLLGRLTAGIYRAANDTTIRALKAGAVTRHVDLFGISPETMTQLELVGTGADLHPEQDSTADTAAIPRSKDTEAFFHIAGSPDLASWATSTASIRDYHYTDAALLGQIMDDNGGVYGLVRTSFGYFDGAPMRRNRLPEQTTWVPGLSSLVTPGALMLPRRTPVPALVRWRNYDELGSGSSQLGRGVTTPASEVTDARQFARILHEGPTNLTENWFPLRIVIDLGLLAAGDRSGSLRGAVHGRATELKPRVAVIAGDGVVGARSRPLDPRVVVPGYQHLDVLTAAERQNGGQPEGSSQTLVNLVQEAVHQ